MRKSLSNFIAGLPGTKAILSFLIEKANGLPDADRLRKIVEERVAAMPEEKREAAQRQMDEIGDKWPTNEEFKAVMDDITEKLNPENLSEGELEEVEEFVKRELVAEK